MEEKKITQQELIKLAKTEGIKLTDRIVNYYINRNLLPMPIRTKNSPSSDKAENIFDYNHTVFMLEILKKYKLFGFSKISQMKFLLSGGRYTIYEELKFLSNYSKLKGGYLHVYCCTVKVNDREFKNIARHSVYIAEDLEFDDYPFFPNYDLWYFVNHKKTVYDEYGFKAERTNERTYFEIKIPNEKEIDPKKYLSENFIKLYF